jgi:hypothetical protein
MAHTSTLKGGEPKESTARYAPIIPVSSEGGDQALRDESSPHIRKELKVRPGEVIFTP